jgi:hypothetical protein
MRRIVLCAVLITAAASATSAQSDVIKQKCEQEAEAYVATLPVGKYSLIGIAAGSKVQSDCIERLSKGGAAPKGATKQGAATKPAANATTKSAGATGAPGRCIGNRLEYRDFGHCMSTSGNSAAYCSRICP